MQFKQDQDGIKDALKETFTAKEGAAYLRISYWKFLEEAKAGRLPHFRVGSRVLCRRSSLDLWMKGMEEASIYTEPERSVGKIRRLK